MRIGRYNKAMPRGNEATTSAVSENNFHKEIEGRNKESKHDLHRKTSWVKAIEVTVLSVSGSDYVFEVITSPEFAKTFTKYPNPAIIKRNSSE
jgi:hypothetical protein